MISFLLGIGATLAVALPCAVALVARLRRAEAILAGREKPPSVEEMQAHAAAHPWGGNTTRGRWLVKTPVTGTGLECSAVAVLEVRPDGRCFWATTEGGWREFPDNPSGEHDPGSRWWPLDRTGVLTAITRAK